MFNKEYIIKAIKKTDAYKKYYSYRWREREIHEGNKNPDKCFYIIRRHSIRAGLFSFVLTNLGAIKKAIDDGYVPVIDMMNSPNPMISADEVGKVNGWDLFFAQPSGYSMDSIKGSKRIILGTIDPPEIYPDYPILDSEEEISYWRDQMHRNIHVLPEIEKACNDFIAKEFSDGKALGVLCRGTDYTASKPHGHPIQPDVDEVISEVRKLINEQDYKKIYLATEDEGIWNSFITEFGDKVISYQKHHFNTGYGENINDVANEKLSPYERNREYLISLYILSKCNGLIAGITSGSIGALLMSDGYEYCHMYQLGTYE